MLYNCGQNQATYSCSSPVAFEAETGFMELVLYQQRGLEWRQTAAFRPWFFLGVLFKYMHCYSNALV